MATTMRRLTGEQVRSLDPYSFLALLGKRVIRPGGRRSTEELFQLGEFDGVRQVLDVGCGVATTAIKVARRFGSTVTAVDIAPLMVGRARKNVEAAQVQNRVTVEYGDILALSYPPNSFDRVVAEAVTMFVDRAQAAAELVRVCKPGGRVLATEFLWRHPPSAEARAVFLGQVCPGMQVDNLDDWVRIYQAAGLSDVRVRSGPFEMMTPRGFLEDEGVVNALRIMARALVRPAYLQKMTWLMPRISRAVSYLGYIVVAGTKL